MPLLERDATLEAMETAIGRAAGGDGSIVVVAGDAGIGKTALVRTLAELASDHTRVLYGTCDDLLAPPAFGPWIDIARGIGGPLAEALSPVPDTGAVLAAIVEEATGGPGVTVFVIEDLQWADDATLDSLRYLGRRVANLPTVVVLTYRGDELARDHPLLGLLGQLHGQQTIRITLEPLSESAVSELAAGSSVDPHELHRVTGGNPFFIREVLASGGKGVPATVRDAVLDRLRHVSDHARDLVTLVALAPGGLEVGVATELSNGNIEAISEAENHGILETVDERLLFHNELARQTVEESVTSAQRTQTSQRVLEGLRDVATGSRLLHLAVAAGDLETLIVHGPDAARRCAASGAHRQAATWFRTVLDHQDRLDPRDRAQLLYEYGTELHLLNRIEEATSVASQAVDEWEGQSDATALGQSLMLLARNQHFLGRTASAYESAQRAVAVLEEGGTDEALASAYVSSAALYVWRHRMTEALVWGERARGLAQAIDHPEILSDALNYLGVAKVITGDDSGFDDLAESVAIAERIGNTEFHARGSNNLATSLFNRLRYTEGVEVLRGAVEEAKQAELLSVESNMRGLLGQGLLMVGKWDEAEAVLRPLVEDAADDLLAAPSFGYLGRLLMRQGKSEGDELIDRGLAIDGVDGTLLRFGAVAVPAIERAWLAGDSDTASRLHARITDLASSTGALDWVGTAALYAARAGVPVEPPDPSPPSFVYGIEGDWEQAAAAWLEVGDPYERSVELVLSGREQPGLEGIHILEKLGAARTVDWARRYLEETTSRPPG